MAAAHIFGRLSRQVYTEMKNLFPYKCFSTIPFPEIWLASITPAIHPSLGSWQKMCVCVRAILGQLHATVAINGDKSTIYRALPERMEEICNFTVKTRCAE